MEYVISFLKDDEGATAAEYSIMAALIAAMILGSVFFFGEQVKNLFDHTVTEMNTHNI